MGKIISNIVAGLVVVALIFVVVSLCLASAHGHGLVSEWQSWFGIVKTPNTDIQEAVRTLLIK